jgi:hypothetical protein
MVRLLDPKEPAMIDATIQTIATPGPAAALLPFVVGVLPSVVAVGRLPRAAHVRFRDVKLA